MLCSISEKRQRFVLRGEQEMRGTLRYIISQIKTIDPAVISHVEGMGKQIGAQGGKRAHDRHGQFQCQENCKYTSLFGIDICYSLERAGKLMFSYIHTKKTLRMGKYSMQMVLKGAL